nr:MAG TPA: hypothetical protein [Caudoviricetes sp.]
MQCGVWFSRISLFLIQRSNKSSQVSHIINQRSTHFLQKIFPSLEKEMCL